MAGVVWAASSMLSCHPLHALQAGSTSADADAQWQALAAVVLAWSADPAALTGDAGRRQPRLSVSSGTTTPTPRRQSTAGTMPAPDGDGGAAWEQLLRSEHHQRHGSRFAWAAAPQRAALQDAAAAAAAAAGAKRDEVWRALQALHSGASAAVG